MYQICIETWFACHALKVVLLGNISEIKTGIDRFLEMINTAGETKVDVAASKLGVPAETIEIWAEILQQDNVIEIGYDGFGKMTVKPKNTEIQNASTPQIKPKAPENNANASSTSILKRIMEKAAWKKRREIQTKTMYSERLNPEKKDAENPSGENAISRFLKRLGIKR